MWELKIRVREAIRQEWLIHTEESYGDDIWSNVFTAPGCGGRAWIENEFLNYAQQLAQWRIGGERSSQPVLNRFIDLVDQRHMYRYQREVQTQVLSFYSTGIISREAAQRMILGRTVRGGGNVGA